MAIESRPREAIALSDGDHELLRVIEELEQAGINLSELSGMPSLESVRKLIRDELHMVEKVEDGLDISHASPINRVYVGQAQGALIGGPLYVGACGAIFHYASYGADLRTIVMAGCIGGAIGGLIGIVLAAWIHRRHQKRINQLIDKGRMLLFAYTRHTE